jgi:L-cysteine S-thiosulfotransferase
MKMSKWVTTGVAAVGFAIAMVGSSVAVADVLDEGKALAFNKKKGNCLACHRIEGGSQAGDIAPPILMMKLRYPNKAELRAQIWDATAANPHSVMPPFGRHDIMSDSEIDKVTEFIYSL